MLQKVPREDELVARITLAKMWFFVFHAVARKLTEAEIDELRASVFFIRGGVIGRGRYNDQIDVLCSFLLAPGGLEDITEEGRFDLLMRVSELREILEIPESSEE